MRHLSHRLKLAPGRTKRVTKVVFCRDDYGVRWPDHTVCVSPISRKSEPLDRQYVALSREQFADLIARVRKVCAEATGRDTTVDITPDQYEGECEFLEAIDEHEWERTERAQAWVRTGLFRDVNTFVALSRTSLHLTFENGTQHERNAIRRAVEDELPRFDRSGPDVVDRLRKELLIRLVVPFIVAAFVVLATATALGFNATNVLVGYGVAAPFYFVTMKLLSKREQAVKDALPPVEFLADDKKTRIEQFDASSHGRLGVYGTWATVLSLPVAVIAMAISAL